MNLRTRAPVASASAADTAAMPAIEPRRNRLPLIAGGALAAAAVVGVVLAIVLTRGHTADSRTITIVPATAPLGVSAAAMGSVLTEYVDAYGAEDLQTLRALFSPDLVRVNGSDPPQDRAGALDTYAKQFQQLSNPRYGLSDVRYRDGETTGQASGNYRITSDSGVNTGRIAFRFTAQDGSVLIDRILIEPLS